MKLRELLNVYHGTQHTKQAHEIKVSIECIHVPEAMEREIEDFYNKNNYQIDHSKDAPNVINYFERVYCGEMRINVNKSVEENTGLTEEQLNYDVTAFDVFDNGMVTWLKIECIGQY